MRRSYLALLLALALSPQASLARRPLVAMEVSIPKSGFAMISNKDAESLRPRLLSCDSASSETRLQEALLDQVTSSSGLAVRGGAATSPKKKKEATRYSAKTISLSVLGGTILAYLCYTHRQFFNKQYMQDTTLSLLERTHENPYGIVLYILGMAVWELIGLSTIPVETAAGMAFGFKRGVAASTVGKLLGAGGAFMLGRGLLRDFVVAQLADNEFLKLVQASVSKNPVKTCILMKYSCFPEFVKNYGSSLLDAINVWTLLFATLVHGGPFTMLWTYLGVDTVKRLESTETLPVDQVLRISLIVAGLIGFIVSPVVVALWIKDLREQQKQQQLPNRRLGSVTGSKTR